MGISVLNPAAVSGGKTRKVETLTSGTSWTVPAGVTYVNVTLVGAGGGGSAGAGGSQTNPKPVGLFGSGGKIVQSTVSTTPGNSISYSIGAGGSAGVTDNYDGTTTGNGGNTTFTGATTASGGGGAARYDSSPNGPNLGANNGGAAGGWYSSGTAGGDGWIVIEYWV